MVTGLKAEELVELDVTGSGWMAVVLVAVTNTDAPDLVDQPLSAVTIDVAPAFPAKAGVDLRR